MRYPVRAAWALVSIIGVATIMALYLRHPAADETDNCVMPEPVVQWNGAVMRGQELEDQTRRARERNDAKDAVVIDVITGRLNLFEAAARFRNINDSNPQAEHWLTSFPYHGQPYELALCRSVIRRVELELESRGTGAEETFVARLQAELAEHLRRHGRVYLPNW